jgi:hypothetical protein
MMNVDDTPGKLGAFGEGVRHVAITHDNRWQFPEGLVSPVQFPHSAAATDRQETRFNFGGCILSRGLTKFVKDEQVILTARRRNEPSKLIRVLYLARAPVADRFPGQFSGKDRCYRLPAASCPPDENVHWLIRLPLCITFGRDAEFQVR